jgi:hypothetical protein
MTENITVAIFYDNKWHYKGDDRISENSTLEFSGKDLANWYGMRDYVEDYDGVFIDSLSGHKINVSEDLLYITPDNQYFIESRNFCDLREDYHGTYLSINEKDECIAGFGHEGPDDFEPLYELNCEFCEYIWLADCYFTETRLTNKTVEMHGLFDPSYFQEPNESDSEESSNDSNESASDSDETDTDSNESASDSNESSNDSDELASETKKFKMTPELEKIFEDGVPFVIIFKLKGQ